MKFGDAVRGAEARLTEAGVETPRLDARILTAAAADVTPDEIFLRPDNEFDGGAEARLDEMVARRAGREPVSRILGRREFWSLEFALTPDTLDPRPDSEVVVAAALDAVPARHQSLRVLDLGTGSGCLLLALLSELPRATGVGVDLVPGACEAARGNAARLGLAGRARIVQGSWDAAVGERFDLVVSNPPYVPSGDIPGLAPEVARHDPQLALAGGADGLEAYRAIAEVLPGVLAPRGAAFLEIGDTQADAVSGILANQGLWIAAVHQDLGGRPRCVVAAREGGIPPVAQ